MPIRPMLAGLVALLAISGVLAVLLLGGSRDDEDTASSSAGEKLRVPWIDPDGQDPIVGGLDVNPRDRSVWLSSNTGLFRIAPESKRPEQVTGELTTDLATGEISEQLAIRFRGPDDLVASGHPPGDSDLPPVLGLIQSRDAGKTWDAISGVGEADYHAIQLARGTVVAALYGQRAINISRDGGKTFSRRAPPAAIVDLEVDPRRTDRWITSTPGGLFVSSNGGKAWRQREPIPYSRFAWPASDALYRVDPGGPVKRSDDGGTTWQDVGNTGGEPQALAAATPELLYAALLDGTVKASRDGGSTWSDLVQP
jgi:hypothetical protein